MTEVSIAVVGGGFSGALAAVHLLRQEPARRLHILLLDRAGSRGAGLAYGTTSPVHMLNVPVGRLGVFADDPEGFLRFARAEGVNAGPGDFLPRRLYGRYLEEQLRAAVATSNARLEILTAEVVAIEPPTAPAQGTALLALADGREISADRVLLAPGNLPSVPLRLPHLPDHPLIQDPWQPGALDAIAAHESVLAVGTGLTLLDVVAELRRRGHTGPIYAQSRRGLLPQPHVVHRSVASSAEGLPSDLRGLTRAVRQLAKTEQKAGGDWRAAVDALRPVTPALWRGLTSAEKGRFLRHLRPYWDVHRHRVAPELARELEDWLARGELTVLAGRLLSAVPAGERCAIAVRPRGTGDTIHLEVDRIVNCTGPASDLSAITDPLLVQLRARGLLHADPFGLGAQADESGAVLDDRGAPSSWLFGVGPMFRGRDWEGTAVPELRRRAAEVASSTLASLETAPVMDRQLATAASGG